MATVVRDRAFLRFAVAIAASMQPSIFQSIAWYAPPERVGAYLGVFSFLSGRTVFAGGALFEAGPAEATTALAALAVLGPVSAAACTRSLTRRR